MVICGNKGHFKDKEEDSLRFWIPHAQFMSETTLESSVPCTLQIPG